MNQKSTEGRVAAGLPVVAVVGRPNVGKSSLFNRILQRREAIVAAESGVTRDVLFAVAEWAGRSFQLVDTGGLVPRPGDQMEAEVLHQVEAAIEHADLLLFVVDTRAGLLPLDREVADLLRRRRPHLLVVANKADRMPQELGTTEFFALGLGEPYPVSATQGKGVGDLLDAVVTHLPSVSSPPPDGRTRLAVVGRPNVGKSTLVNRLLGVTRVLVAPEPGTTRDTVDTELELDGRRIVLIDTAGLRRAPRIEGAIEYYASLRAIRSLERAEVALLLLDGPEGLVRQDLRIAGQILERGRGLVILVNKWDAVEERGGKIVVYRDQLLRAAPLLSDVPVHFLSALTGRGAEEVLPLALRVAQARNQRVPTATVNEIVHDAVDHQPPPSYRGREVKLFYATQVASAPPTVVIFTNLPAGVTSQYRRYLERVFREAIPLSGVPLRLYFRARRRDRRRPAGVPEKTR